MAKAQKLLGPKTPEFMKHWEKWELPCGQVTGGSITPGTYRGIAVLGWLEQRNGVPTVGLQTIVLRNQEDKHVGAVTLGFPVTPKTELYVNALLQTFGWDGRVWPYDDDKKWPDGTTDEDQVMGLIQKVGLSSTLTFAPQEGVGVPTVRLQIPKRSGPFQLPPLEEMNSPPVHLDRFRELVKDMTIFKPTN